MNFIDKYKEDLKNGNVEIKLPEDGITEEDLKKLKEVAYEDSDEIREHVAALVPTYHPKKGTNI